MRSLALHCAEKEALLPFDSAIRSLAQHCFFAEKEALLLQGALVSCWRRRFQIRRGGKGVAERSVEALR